MPSRTSWPAGVCIQLLAERIQNADVAVPNATIAAESISSHGGTRLQANSSTPRNVASRKKAVSTSSRIAGLITLPVTTEKLLQLVPTWYDSTMPDTSPMPNDTANILVQNRASS